MPRGRCPVGCSHELLELKGPIAKTSGRQPLLPRKGERHAPQVDGTSRESLAGVVVERCELSKVVLPSDRRVLLAKMVDSRRQGCSADKVCGMLTVHTKIEEEIFYPAAREAGLEEDMMDEARVEHDVAKSLIAWIQSSKPSDDYYDAKVKVLGDIVETTSSNSTPRCSPSAGAPKWIFSI